MFSFDINPMLLHIFDFKSGKVCSLVNSDSLFPNSDTVVMVYFLSC